MSSKKHAHHSAKKLFGVPSKIVMDGAREQVLGSFKKACEDATVLVQQLEYNTPWANRAEGAVRENKRASRRAMKKSDCPAKLWDYCAELVAKIRCHTAHDIPTLNGQVPETVVTGNTADISELVEFGWYQWVYYRDATTSYPLPDEELGRYLGPSENVGSKMSMWILKGNGEVVSRTTLRPLNDGERSRETEKIKREEFTKAVNLKLGPSLYDIGIKSDLGDYFDDTDTPEHTPYVDNEGVEASTMPEADDIADYDRYIESEVLLPRNGAEMSSAKVVRRVKDKDGKVVGSYHNNPILDTRVYDVMFPDGAVAQYAANVIAESMYSQVDSNGHHTLLLKEITDHRKSSSAIPIDDKYIISKTGRKSLRKTTKGWDFLCLWKDGSSTWAPLKDLKESNPVDVAEYVVGNRISEEAAFAWWVPCTLKKRDHIISKVKARFLKKSHKFGVQVPTSVENAYELDKENGNTLWRDAIKKEMDNVAVAFHILDHGESEPVGYEHINCHLIFDVKMDFRRKARFVAGGHTTNPPSESTYAGVVSRESVRIAFTIAALNDLDIFAADIQNAYLTAPCGEKIIITCGPEFGSEHKGKIAVVVRALYGLRSSGSSFRNHLASCMEALGYTPCKADPDVWMRRSRKADGTEYYQYMLLYVDDCLAISEHPKEAVLQLDKYFKMQPNSIGPPDIHTN